MVHFGTLRLVGKKPDLYRQLVWLPALLLLVPGCGKPGPKGPQATVHGKAMAKGSPVPEGTVVSFMGETGAGGSAKVGADGAYRLVGPTGGETIPAGKYKVVFMPPATGAMTTSDEEMQELMKHNPAEEPPQTNSLIPDKYQNLSTTTAEHEVKEGDNEINIDLVE